MSIRLYYAGIQIPEADVYFEEKSLPRLLSYWNDKKKFQSRADRGHKTFLDSGAYTAWTKGVEINVEEYIKYVNEWDKGLEFFMQLDKIPGRFGEIATLEEKVEASEATYSNYVYMRGKVNNPDKLIPVFHAGNDPKYLQKLLDFEPKVPVIAIGKVARGVSRGEKEKRLHEIFKIIKKSNYPDVKIHLLGVNDFNILKQFPAWSCDAITWLKSSANGYVLTPTGFFLVSKKSEHKKEHYLQQSQEVRDIMDKQFKKYGTSYKELSENYKARSMHNVKYLEDAAKEYECSYKIATTKQTTLF